jgi:NIMA (never in mitosis gene a)-related kinase
MSLSDFEVLEKLGNIYFALKGVNLNVYIGSGAYSTVFKVRRLEDDVFYAMKKVDINDLSIKEKQNALNEIRILASISHSNIVAYKESFVDEPSSMLW